MRYLILLLLVGCGQGSDKEFVCYMDDQITERHVGVSSTTINNPNGMWYITYVDTDNAVFYLQQRGENCLTMEVTK